MPLAYLTRSDPIAPVTLDDFISNKCYSATYKSLVEELVARKSNSSSCVEADKILLYGHLDKAFQVVHLSPYYKPTRIPKMTRPSWVLIYCNMVEEETRRKRTRGWLACWRRNRSLLVILPSQNILHPFVELLQRLSVLVNILTILHQQRENKCYWSLI